MHTAVQSAAAAAVAAAAATAVVCRYTAVAAAAAADDAASLLFVIVCRMAKVVAGSLNMIPVHPNTIYFHCIYPLAVLSHLRPRFSYRTRISYKRGFAAAG